MKINVPGILSVSLSGLSSFSSSDTMDEETLFHIECAQPTDTSLDKRTASGYKSSKMLFDQLVQVLKNDFQVAKFDAALQNMEMSLEVPSSLVVMENSVPTRRFVLSAVSENTRASINGVSCYNMTEAIKDILNVLTIPRLSATVSPWLLKANVANEWGDSRTKAASQNLVSQTSNKIGEYLPKSQVKNNITDASENNATTQKVFWGIRDSAENILVLSTKIAHSLGDSSEYIASANLIKNLSSAVSPNYHRKQLATVLGNSTVSAAAVSLVRSLSSAISSNFLKKSEETAFLKKSSVVSIPGDDTTLAASQKLITDISAKLSSGISANLIYHPTPNTDGDVFYVTPDGKGKSQPLANQNVFVCEDETDIDKTIRAGMNFRNVFDQWTRGGVFGSKYYERDSDYYAPRYGGLTTLLDVYGVSLNDLETGNFEEVSEYLNKTIQYGIHHDRFNVKITKALRNARVSHALSTDGYISCFDSRDMSVVLFNLTAYNNKPGTCIYNLSSSSGALNGYYGSRLSWIASSQLSAILSDRNFGSRTIEMEADDPVRIYQDDYGYPYWIYNTTLSSIIQIVNTTDYSYFISNVKYDKYDVIFRAFSGASDDDFIGFIAAYGTKTINNNNYPIMITVARSPNTQNERTTMWHWKINFDSAWVTNGSNLIRSGHVGSPLSDITQQIVIDDYASLSVQDTVLGRYTASYINGGRVPDDIDAGKSWAYEKSGGWNGVYDNHPEISSGVLIRVKRDGDGISAWTTEFGQEPIVENLGHLLTVDLNERGTTTWGVNLNYLSCLQGAQSIGFSMISQPNTQYEIKKFEIPMKIINTKLNDLSSYDGNTWTKLSKLPSTEAGPGRLTRNPYTEKLFYVQPNSFIKLYQP